MPRSCNQDESIHAERACGKDMLLKGVGRGTNHPERGHTIRPDREPCTHVDPQPSFASQLKPKCLVDNGEPLPLKKISDPREGGQSHLRSGFTARTRTDDDHGPIRVQRTPEISSKEGKKKKRSSNTQQHAPRSHRKTLRERCWLDAGGESVHRSSSNFALSPIPEGPYRPPPFFPYPPLTFGPPFSTNQYPVRYGEKVSLHLTVSNNRGMRTSMQHIDIAPSSLTTGSDSLSRINPLESNSFYSHQHAPVSSLLGLYLPADGEEEATLPDLMLSDLINLVPSFEIVSMGISQVENQQCELSMDDPQADNVQGNKKLHQTC